MKRKPAETQKMSSTASAVETPVGAVSPAMANEFDVLYEIFVHGNAATLKSLTLNAMMSLSGGQVDDVLVDEYFDAARKYVEFLHEAISSRRVPFPKA